MYMHTYTGYTEVYAFVYTFLFTCTCTCTFIHHSLLSSLTDVSQLVNSNGQVVHHLNDIHDRERKKKRGKEEGREGGREGEKNKRSHTQRIVHVHVCTCRLPFLQILLVWCHSDIIHTYKLHVCSWCHYVMTYTCTCIPWLGIPHGSCPQTLPHFSQQTPPARNTGQKKDICSPWYQSNYW